MISVVLPMSGVPEITDECIAVLKEHAIDDLDIIVIDNASEYAYQNDNARILRNTQNVGFWPSMIQGLKNAKSNIVLCMHNDVFVWEHGWDKRIRYEFQEYDLGMAGFFGGRGVHRNGGRMHPESNMVALKYGTHGNLHGHILTGSHPAVVFDSLAMIFDREKLFSIDYGTIPPHHWTDRIVTLRMINAGYAARTIGIAFDHMGSATAIGNHQAMLNFTEHWCKSHDLKMEENWDMTLYRYGAIMFWNELNANELHVNSEGRYIRL